MVLPGLDQIRSDHGTEFDNAYFKGFCTERGIKHKFSAPKTPQQNGAVEREKQSCSRNGLSHVNTTKIYISQRFWAEAVNTAVFVINWVYLRPETKPTPYEI